MPASKKSDKQIVILHGNDEFLVDQTARKVLAERCPDAEATGSLSTIPGDSDTIDQALNAIKQTLSAVQSFNMFSAENATWLKEVTFLSGPVFKSDEVKESVEKMQETLSGALGPEQFLLITVQGKLDSRSRFFKTLKDVADIRDFSKSSKPWEVEKESVDALRQQLDAMGIRASASVVEQMSARVGGDTRLMMQEVEKIDLYLGKRRELTLQDVEDMVGTQPESQVFQLADCIATHKLDKAMELLGRLENQGASPIAVIATLHNSLREMAYLRALIGEGSARVESNGRFGKLIYTDPEAKEGFQRLVGDKTRSPFRQYQLGQQSQRFTVGAMDKMVRLSSDTYASMFRSPLPQFELLRTLVLNIFYQCIKKSA
jgi:DNA polymerase III delta subunit